MQYWVHSKGQTYGTYDGDTIKSMTIGGQLSYNDLVCLKGTDNWTSITDTFFPPVQHFPKLNRFQEEERLERHRAHCDAYWKRRGEEEENKHAYWDGFKDDLKSIWKAMVILFTTIALFVVGCGYHKMLSEAEKRGERINPLKPFLQQRD